jgi:hypothetical protein
MYFTWHWSKNNCNWNNYYKFVRFYVTNTNISGTKKKVIIKIISLDQSNTQNAFNIRDLFFVVSHTIYQFTYSRALIKIFNTHVFYVSENFVSAQCYYYCYCYCYCYTRILLSTQYRQSIDRQTRSMIVILHIVLRYRILRR